MFFNFGGKLWCFGEQAIYFWSPCKQNIIGNDPCILYDIAKFCLDTYKLGWTWLLLIIHVLMKYGHKLNDSSKNHLDFYSTCILTKHVIERNQNHSNKPNISVYPYASNKVHENKLLNWILIMFIVSL